MSFTSRSELITEVADLLNRQDLLAKVPSWISLVEAELQRVLEGSDMRTTVDVSFDTTGQFALPDDCIAPVSLTIQTDLVKGPVNITTYERVQDQRGRATNGVPRYAAIVGRNVHIGPIPDSVYEGVLVYDINVAPLSDTNPSNWVLLKYPDVYLYGCALHSAPWLKDDARVEMWRKTFYEPALAQIRKVRDRLEYGGNTLIVRPRSALGA